MTSTRTSFFHSSVFFLFFTAAIFYSFYFSLTHTPPLALSRSLSRSVFVKPFEFGITALHDVVGGYGPAIILFTIALKALTFPLTKQQTESTAKMQAIQPAAKQLQEKYRNKDPARLNMELQKLYQDNQVNPLAGCLPSFAQIPIFIALYRSVLNLAKEDKLTESFLWLPSLEGPVSDYTKGSGWLFGDAAQGYAWNGINPPLGWGDTLAYLALPVLLVISQSISTRILTPQTVRDDPAQQQTQQILKFLPLMIGWFSLNVPSGLGLYWLTNNIVTTATTLYVRKTAPQVELAGGMGSAGSMPTAAPPPQKGFTPQPKQTVSRGSDGTTVTISPPGTRKERRAAAKAEAAAVAPTVVEATVVDATPVVTAVAEPVVAAAAAAEVVEATTAAVDGGVAEPAKKKRKKRSKKSKK